MPRNVAFAGIIAIACSAGACSDSDDTSGGSHKLEQNQRIETNWQQWMARPPRSAATPSAPAFSSDSAAALERDLRTGWSRIDAVIAAAKSGGDAAAGWLEEFVTKDSDPTARAMAVFALGSAARPRSAAALCAWLRDDVPEVGALSMRALGELRAPWTLARIAKDVGRYDANKQLVVRVLACAASLRFQNYSGMPFLLRVLKEQTPLEDAAARDWVKQQRMALEKEAAIAAIREVANDDFGFDTNSSPTRQAEAIGKIEAWWNANRVRLWDASPAIDDVALRERIDELVAAFDDYQISMVDNSRFVLAWLGPKVFPHLEPHLKDPRIYVRVHTLETIESLSDTFGVDLPRVMGAIGPLVHDKDPAVRRAAVGSLGAMAREDAATLLISAVDDADPSVRIAALRALGRVRAAASEAALTRRAASPDHGDEWVAANASLGQLGHSDRLDILLQELMSDDVSQQSRVLDALGLLGAPVARFPLGGSVGERAKARDDIASKLGRR